jgi:hypothetical protein
VARITLGLATSHGPMLSVRPETWPERVKADRANPQHFFKGKTYTFDQLVAVRKAEHLYQQVSLDVFRERHARCQQAIRTLADIFEAHKPDVAVVVGNDQMEVFTKENFDVTQLTRLTTGEIGSNAVPHAWGFVYRRIMRDKVVPHVPVFVNTFYPPNQPPGVRCFDFGARHRPIDRVMGWERDSRGDRFGRPDALGSRRILRPRGTRSIEDGRHLPGWNIGNQKLDHSSRGYGRDQAPDEHRRLRAVLPVGGRDWECDGVYILAVAGANNVLDSSYF